MLGASCFLDEVGRPTKSKDIDAETDEMLGLIESAWRKAGHDTLDGLTYEDGEKEKGIVASSTWYGWRNGSRKPKYAELLSVARAVGVNVRPSINDGLQSERGPTLTSKMRQILTTISGLPEHVQEDILSFAERHAKMWSGAANPTKADVAEHQ